MYFWKQNLIDVFFQRNQKKQKENEAEKNGRSLLPGLDEEGEEDDVAAIAARFERKYVSGQCDACANIIIDVV